MKVQTKLALRRFALRWLRKLVDVADDRLHAAEVRLRGELSLRVPVESSGITRAEGAALQDSGAVKDDEFSIDRVSGRIPRSGEPERSGETFSKWEARRSGLVPGLKRKSPRVHRHRTSAKDFDFQIIRKREEFVQ